MRGMCNGEDVARVEWLDPLTVEVRDEGGVVRVREGS